MRPGEAACLEWLVRKGYQRDEIGFRSHLSPDFLTSDGKTWEEKTLRNNKVVFGREQLDILVAAQSTVVVFNGGSEPVAVWKASELVGKSRHDGVVILETPSVPKSTQSLVTVRSGYAITIPSALRMDFPVKPGDVVEVLFDDGVLVIRRSRFVPETRVLRGGT